MNNPKWTPGPWSVFIGVNHFLIEHPRGGINIARTYRTEEEGQERANADLLGAAPAMYESLMALSWHREGTCWCYPLKTEDESNVGHCSECKQTRSALAKARGESQ